jgi:hypothetical protein
MRRRKRKGRQQDEACGQFYPLRTTGVNHCPRFEKGLKEPQNERIMPGNFYRLNKPLCLTRRLLGNSVASSLLKNLSSWVMRTTLHV